MKDGKWTSDYHLAQHFRETPDVYEAAAHFHLADVDLYYLIADAPSDYDITIPLFSSQIASNAPRRPR